MVLSKKMWFFEKVLLFYVVLTFFGNNLLILRFFGKRKVVENFLNTLIFIAAGKKDTFTAGKFKPFGSSYGNCVGVIALCDDTDDRSCGHTDDIGREKRKGFGCGAEKSDNISLARIDRKCAAELSVLDVFAGRIYDTLAIINILCFMIMYFLVPQSLYKRAFSAFAAAYKDKFSHLPVFFFYFGGGVLYFGLKQIIFFKVQLYSPHFSESKEWDKRFSPLKRRSESAASSPHIKLSSLKLFHASEILNLRSQMLRTARWGWYLCTSWLT